MEAIILAGGLGTRLRSEVADLPKCMALIRERPFMEYLLDHLIENGVERVIFSLGYKSEYIQTYFSDNYKGCKIIYAIEEELLGTGGAIKNAMRFAQQENVVVLNGDSIIISDLKEQYQKHIDFKADVTLALKYMNDFERYGTVLQDENDRIIQFLEKQPLKEGYINAGLYIFNVASFQKLSFPEKFSIENDFFEAKVDELRFFGYKTNGYFLDIGIPKDFKRAQIEIGVFSQVDKEWTLFLDRDGVINKKRDNDYVKKTAELELLPGAIKTIANLSNLFGRVIIVTNQQGIGKRLMTEKDLHEIHEVISEDVIAAGGKIHAIYYAPQLASEGSDYRKPGIGMALQAKEDFPEIDFTKSIMVGDSKSDMEFGRAANLINVFVSDQENTDEYTIRSLTDFGELMQSIL